MFSFLCKVFGHNFKYSRRYYRCTRCGVRRCDLKVSSRAAELVSDCLNVVDYPKEGFDMVAKARDVWEKNSLSVGNIPDKETK